LVLFIFIETEMTKRVKRSVLGLVTAEEHAPIFRPLVVEKQDPSGILAVGTGYLLSVVKLARELSLIRNDQPRSTVRLNDIDAMHCKLIEVQVPRIPLLGGRDAV
jgi:hypothetical protein